jgi:hypothetical protein
MSTQVQMMAVIAAATTTATVEEAIAAATTTATVEEAIAAATTTATVAEAILTVDISLHQTTVTIIIVATIPVAVTMGPLHQHQQVAVEHLHQHQQVAVEHLHQLDNYIWHIYGNSLQYTNVPR